MLTRVLQAHAVGSLRRSFVTCLNGNSGNITEAPSPSVPNGQIAHSGVQRKSSVPHGLTHKALLVDAAGTLFEPSEPVTEVYLRLGLKYGVSLPAEEILRRYRRAYAQPWVHSTLRYVDDGRPFWHHILSESSGCSSLDFAEEMYEYYTTSEAWKIIDPRAGEAFAALRKAGVKTAVVSNFDTRLRPILKALECDHWFDAMAISAEVRAEKPNPIIFHKACELLQVEPHEAIHVGDDRRNDVWGARDAGCATLHWGCDVFTFSQVAQELGVHIEES